MSRVPPLTDAAPDKSLVTTVLENPQDEETQLQGGWAFRLGLGADDVNPYPKGDRARPMWFEGWHNARRAADAAARLKSGIA